MTNVYSENFNCFSPQVAPQPLAGKVFSDGSATWSADGDTSLLRGCDEQYNIYFDDCTFDHTVGVSGLGVWGSSSPVNAWVAVDCVTSFRITTSGPILGTGGGILFCNSSYVIVTDAGATVVLHTPGYDQTWTGAEAGSPNLSVDVDFNADVQIAYGDLDVFVTGESFMMENSTNCGLVIPAAEADSHCDSVLPIEIVNFWKCRTFDDCGGGGLGPGAGMPNVVLVGAT